MSFWSDPIGFVYQLLLGLLTGWGLPADAAQFILYLVGAFALATGAMLFVVFLIWLERKLIGRVQDRLGPNRVGPFGLFQTIADMLKIFTKELITPAGVDPVPYNAAPILAVAAVLAVWAVLPIGIRLYGVDLNVGILYVVAVGALGELGIILAGWGSDNKYALLGAFRSVAQLISYEVPMVIILLAPVMMSRSLSLNDIVKAQDVPYLISMPAAALVFFIALVAETGRAPFDLVEAESELVAGFNIEYSGLKFGMFYVADFLHAFTASMLFAALFLGGWRGPGAEAFPFLGAFYFLIKTSLVYFVTLMMRAALPRFRIDQMMDLSWKILTPLALGLIGTMALADKLVPENLAWLKIVVLIVVNLAALWITNTLINRSQKTIERPLVGDPARPVARPPRVQA